MATDRAIPIFYFSRIPNVGDQLNPYIIEKIAGRPARLVESPTKQRHILGIGSMMGAAGRSSRIWGTGVMHPMRPLRPIRADTIFALRGKLTHEHLLRREIRVADVPLGDPGFLLPFWYKPAVEKRYKIGLIPHYRDAALPWVQSAIESNEVALIDVLSPVEAFVNDVLACEVVVSSSLHGLVIAEAYGLPNVWVELSDKVIGKGFKFRDWFSVSRKPQLTAVTSDKTIDEMGRQAVLHDMEIDTEALIRALPLHHVGLVDV